MFCDMTLPQGTLETGQQKGTLRWLAAKVGAGKCLTAKSNTFRAVALT